MAEETVLAVVAEVLQAEAGLAGFEFDGGDAELELGGDELVVFFVQADLAVDVLPGEGVAVFLHGAAGEVEAGLHVAAPADVAAGIEEEAFWEIGVELR